jgi:hypothetical protein
MYRNTPLLTVLAVFLTTVLSSPLIAADINPPGLGAPDEKQAARGHSSKPVYSPYAGRGFTTRPFFGVKPLEDTTMTLQERAYTSPIWYTP